MWDFFEIGERVELTVLGVMAQDLDRVALLDISGPQELLECSH